MWGSGPDRTRSRARRGSRALPVLLALALAAVGAPALALAAKSAAKPKCFGAVRTIQGNNKANTLRGNGARNVIVALGGNDRIYPGSGADLVCAGAGKDAVAAYDGYADRISCGGGFDSVTADPRDVVSRDCERVKRVNSAPTGLTLSRANVNENLARNSVVGVMKSIDKDPNDVGRFALVLGVGSADNKYFTISGSNLLTNVVFDAETRTSYGIRLRVTDSGGRWIEREFTITVNNVNEPPATVALDQAFVTENEAPDVRVGFLSSVDPEGNAVSYSLVAGAGDTGNGSFKIVGNELRTKVTFDRETQSSYSIRVRATDTGGRFFDKVLTIQIANQNEFPTDLALSPSAVAEHLPSGTTVGTLTSDDPDVDDPQTFTLVSGTGSADNAQFTISGNALRTAASFDASTKGSYKVRVRVTDAVQTNGMGPAGPERAFTVTVTEVNDAPTDIALTGASVAENQPVGTAVGTLSSTDEDAGDTATYALVAGAGSADNALFKIVSGDQLQTSAVLDHEAGATRSIRVRVTDSGGKTFEKVLTVTVTDVNEAPTDIAVAPSSIAENQASGTTVGTLTVADPDAGDSASYELVPGAGSADNGSFTISGTSLRTAAVFDRETKASYSIRVRVTDSGGKTFEKVLTVTVTDVNEAPTNIGLSGTSVPENSPNPTTVGTLSATDVDAGESFTFALVGGAGSADNGSFTISGTTLRTAAVFDFETKSSYAIRVRVTDSGGLTFERTFVVSVTDVNDAPTDITLTPASIAENAASGTTVGTLAAADQDAGDTRSFSLVSGSGSTDNASFTVSGSALKSAAVFNFESKSSYSIRVRVVDGAGASFEKVLTVTVTDQPESPTNIALSASTVAENAASGTTVGALTATDADAGETFTFGFVSGTGSADNASFAVVGNQLRTAATFDFETRSTYSVRLEVTDKDGLTFQKAFVITVTDVNEPPTDVTLTPSTIAESAVSGSTVGTLGRVDPDAGETATYTLVPGVGSDDNASFEVSGTSLRTKIALDFETKSTYTVRVQVKDKGNLTFAKALTVTVTDVNEAPTNLVLSPSSIAENSALTSTVGTLSTTDVDAGDTFGYSLVSGAGSTDNGSFTISGNQLRTATALDFEVKSSYAVRVRTTDAGGLTFDKQLTVTVTDVNEAPTDIALSATSVPENAAVGTTVGTLGRSDVDAGDTATFTLVSGAGSDDNGSFAISAASPTTGTLKTGAVFDHEARSTYSVRVRVTDGAGLTFEKAFTVTVTDVNEAPTGLTLTSNTFPEGPSGTTVGSLGAIDPDAGATHTFTLVAGPGGTDNDVFAIAPGGVLETAAAFDFENSTNPYSVRVRATDAGGLTFEGVLSLNVTNVNEAPTGFTVDTPSVADDAAVGTTVSTFTLADPDAGDSGTYSLVSAEDDAFVVENNVLKVATALDAGVKSSYEVTIEVTDSGGLTFQKQVTITVTPAV